MFAGLAAGLGHTPFDLWFLAVPGLVLAAVLYLSAQTIREAGTTLFFTGLGYFVLTLFWIVEPFLVDLARHGWMAPFALLFLASGLSLIWCAAGSLARWISPFGGAGDALAFAVALTLAEVVRTFLFTGFPWALPGYIWMETPIAQWFAWVGPHGMNLATLGVAALIAASIERSRLRLAAGSVLFVVVAGAYATHLALPPVLPSGGPVVRIVQPNAEQHLKWKPEWRDLFLRRAIDLTAEPADVAPEIIVWPETSVPYLLSRAGPVFDAVSEAAGDADTVLGIQRFQGQDAFNSLVVLNGDGALGAVYDKAHLVPFGEYMPFRDFFARFEIYALGDILQRGFSAGPGPRLLDFGAMGKALPLICYEGIFPHLLRTAERPDWLILITNDAWFGQMSGPYQHLAQARLRAIEQGLPMVRAANTGVSAVIDAHGRITASIPLGQAGKIDAPLPPKRPPTLYSQTGDLPAYAMLAICCVIICFIRFCDWN
ncbi:MAG: apolipoprotein N-acyltransferase [Pseudomonadota bacterium]